MRKYSEEAELFDSLQDPVTRFFFKNLHPTKDEIAEFMNQDEFKREVDTNKYKSIIDVEASKVKEARASKPEDSAKKSKRIVLGNVQNKDEHNDAPQDTSHGSSNSTAASLKVCEATCHEETSSAQPNEPNIKPEKENLKMAKVDVKVLDRNMLRDQLQKILASEDNPLL